MDIFKIEPLGFASNSYILTADGKSAGVIDPAEPRIKEILNNKGLKCEAVLLTHGHFDHVGGCGRLFAEGARIYCGEREKDLIFSRAFLNMFGGVTVPEFEINKTFSDGENFEVCGLKFTVMNTAGHSAGSVCYITEDKIFTGDTLMCDGVGRTDLPTGDYSELVKSVKKLYSLSGDYKIYCGHGPNTTLLNERRFNSFVRSE